MSTGPLGAPTRRRFGRKRWIGIALILVACVAGWTFYRSEFGIRPRLARAASGLHAPADMNRVYRDTQGTTSCFVSCGSQYGELHENVIFRTRLSRDAACERTRDEVERDVGPTYAAARLEWWCPFEAHVPSVRKRAKLTVAVINPGDFASHQFEPWFDRVRPPESGELLVWVKIGSGLE
jgi:hypothetical protein